MREGKQDTYAVEFVDVPLFWTHSAPDLRSDLVRHYIRGLMDGDGCISRRGVKKTARFICNDAQPSLATAFMDFVKSQGFSYGAPTRQGGNLTHLPILTRSVDSFLEVLYSDCVIAHPKKLKRALTEVQSWA